VIGTTVAFCRTLISKIVNASALSESQAATDQGEFVKVLTVMTVVSKTDPYCGILEPDTSLVLLAAGLGYSMF
jgi:hypothetical protein